eukprot:1061783-Rhodomonas_salina.1
MGFYQVALRAVPGLRLGRGPSFSSEAHHQPESPRLSASGCGSGPPQRPDSDGGGPENAGTRRLGVVTLMDLRVSLTVARGNAGGLRLFSFKITKSSSVGRWIRVFQVS